SVTGSEPARQTVTKVKARPVMARTTGAVIRERPARRLRSPQVVESSLEAGPTYQRVLVAGPGTIDDLTVVHAVAPQITESQVQIAVHAFALNFGDLLCARGLYPNMPPYPFTPGFEVSGTVIAAGAAVTTVALGDAVIAMMG